MDDEKVAELKKKKYAYTATWKLINKEKVKANNKNYYMLLQNDFICELCNFKSKFQYNFDLHLKTYKHFKKCELIDLQIIL